MFGSSNDIDRFFINQELELKFISVAASCIAIYGALSMISS